MKKIIVFCLLFLIAMFGLKFSRIENKSSVIEIFGEYETVAIVTDENVEIEERKCVKNGKQRIYTYDKSEESLLQEHMIGNELEGIVLHFSLEIDFSYFQQLFKGNLTRASQIENISVYYGYVSSYPKSVIHKGKFVNAQLAKTDNGWVLGFPVILTGF